MKNNAVSFATLQRALEAVGFVKTPAAGPQQVFEHPGLDSVFLFRAYTPRDKVTAADVIEVRKILSERGVLKPQGRRVPPPAIHATGGNTRHCGVQGPGARKRIKWHLSLG
jgi:hypothetical protein